MKKVHVVAAGLAAATTLGAAAVLPMATAQAASASVTVWTGNGDPLAVRQSPSVGGARTAWLRDKQKVTVKCQVVGDKVQSVLGSSDLWDYVEGQGYISDAWVESGHRYRIPGVPDCGGAKPTSKPTQTTPPQSGQGDITRADLEKMFPGHVAETSRVQEGLPELNAEMKRRGITTPARKAAFLATLAHESGFDYAIGENGYDPYTYRGRGYIQITGEGNYQSAGSALGVDLMGANQGNASKIPYSQKIAGWYWGEARPNSNAAADRFDMGAVSAYIGYDIDNNPTEDGKRCESFKRAYQIMSGQAAPGTTVCARHY